MLYLNLKNSIAFAKLENVQIEQCCNSDFPKQPKFDLVKKLQARTTVKFKHTSCNASYHIGTNLLLANYNDYECNHNADKRMMDHSAIECISLQRKQILTIIRNIKIEQDEERIP